ncbi:uncharacterized protein LOC136026418 [Artemia franciscana]|uniref:Uncharacterized protein n=1 Tax=Artemia franciscana TaxID=6661 RepID=A0AA88HRX0_ARTSF|nr:hypothetical protein QYM36_012039 [Artemia franciscana]
MFKFIILPLFVAAVSHAENEDARFIMAEFGKTITFYKFTSATTTVSSTPYCFTATPSFSTTVDADDNTLTSTIAPSNCRRKRWAFENPSEDNLAIIEAGSPTAVSIAETTDLPELRPVENDGETYLVDASINSEDLEKSGGQERFFGIGISTERTTVTSFSTVTNNAPTRTVSVGCIPQGQGAISRC